MNETPFYKTRMGQRFYEHTMPELVKQLARLNDLLERFPQNQPSRTRRTGDALPQPTDPNPSRTKSHAPRPNVAGPRSCKMPRLCGPRQEMQQEQ